MHKSLVVLGLALGLAGCAHKGAPAAETAPTKKEADIDAGLVSEKSASAHLEPKSGDTSLKGHATFEQTPVGVKLTLHVEGAPAGEHGAHIHEKGDCSDPEAKNAGGHWNPAGHHHGAPPPTASHLGDLGNLTVGADGTGHLEVTSEAWKLGDGSAEDLVGKAVVIHGGPDDLVSDPAGNSGPRIGCGVIQ
ncbi:MAG TPA: superoxide dismutase family protein [Polyangiales bacterium]|nr:superoxide dismutase family protein [Polyangiales bacterium]